MSAKLKKKALKSISIETAIHLRQAGNTFSLITFSLKVFGLKFMTQQLTKQHFTITNQMKFLVAIRSKHFNIRLFKVQVNRSWRQRSNIILHIQKSCLRGILCIISGDYFAWQNKCHIFPPLLFLSQTSTCHTRSNISPGPPLCISPEPFYWH